MLNEKRKKITERPPKDMAENARERLDIAYRDLTS